MTDDMQSQDSTMGLQVACDTAVSGCVFRMRTEEDDRERLLEVTREHVRERHGRDVTIEEIEDQHVETVEVPLEEQVR
ncbi:DUF1059 domain-containing protein [Natrinema salsiterrestre]|uniref:DUF1059 domain-containing protein n=1 Tax=Natrinema salsiterrestre TaxID=2950540 RepID=A0A9Q4L7N1_9EURY|nr:DUF1059 domain-containing protein [Natrinema salsiterrestre]MDF9746741.1 DUF1059 domain-containing protein [Natrinema salsiterrestre]